MSARDGLPVSVDGRRFELDVEGVSWRTIPATREGSDQGAGPGEQSLSMENVWRRTRDNWILGAGQDYADLIDGESSSLRFRSSSGINPWTTRSLTVLPTALLKRASANSGLEMEAVIVNGVEYLVVIDGAWIGYSSTFNNSSPTFSAFDLAGNGGPFTMTTDGNRIWAVGGGYLIEYFAGTAGGTHSLCDVTMIAYANGRLLGSIDNVLYEVHGDSSTTEIWTHPNDNFVWRGIAASPGGIYAYGDMGQQSEVYSIGVIDATGALDVPYVASAFPTGERILAMTSYAGVMVLGTTRGIRLALITGGGFLQYGPLIDEPGEVCCFSPRGEDVWFNWTDASKMGLGRLRLARFTEDLVPAFATDIRVTGTSDVVAAVTVGDRQWFAVDGAGFYGQTTTLVSTAEIDLGWFTYGISEEKVIDTLSIWCDDLPSGCSIVGSVYLEDEDVALFTLTINTLGATTGTAAYDGVRSGERARVVLTVTQAGATSVNIRRVTLRAAPRLFVAQMVTLPLFLSDEVQSAGHQVGQDPYVEFTWLEALLQARTRFPLTVGEWEAEARLEGLEVVNGGLGGGNGLEGWSDRRRFMAGKWNCTFITVEPSS